MGHSVECLFIPSYYTGVANVRKWSGFSTYLVYRERRGRVRDKQTKTRKSGWLFIVVECDSGDMQCGGRCVPDHQICDGISHCPNGEDERNCCMYKFFSVGSIVIDIDGHWLPNSTRKVVKRSQLAKLSGWLAYHNWTIVQLQHWVVLHDGFS